MNLQYRLAEKNLIPDFLIRWKIRKLLKQRLIDETKPTQEEQQQHLMQLLRSMQEAPVALNTQEANEQHYEVPDDFFTYIMGKHMKYSSCYWKQGITSLDDAEAEALKRTCEHAQIQNGMEVLELGCGWGSLTLFVAEQFPGVHITGVSNSASQKLYIEARCKERGLQNVQILTADMNTFSIQKTFDRVVSVEMFEHMRNYEKLMEKVAGFLKPDGKLFVHIFTHKELTYFFEVKDETDWMSKYFFTGGIMPSDYLLFYFQKHLKISNHWHWDGTHYEKTANAWLQNMDAHKKEILPVLQNVYGEKQAQKWWMYWRIFFMACAELWGYKNGREWFVSHYIFEKPETE